MIDEKALMNQLKEKMQQVEGLRDILDKNTAVYNYCEGIKQGITYAFNLAGEMKEND